MSDWQECKLEDVAEKIGMGPFGSNIKISTFVSEGIPVISGTHLHGIRLEDKEYNFVTLEHANSLLTANVYPGDVIFTHAGNIGQVAVIPQNSKYPRYILSQRQFYFRPRKEKISAEYLTYYFKSNEGQYKLLANANQTGVPSLAQPVSYLKTIDILLPPLPEQRAIAAVFSSLDDKIDLLNRQNKTLEGLAQTLFRKWFEEEDDNFIQTSANEKIRLGDIVETVSKTHPLDRETIIFLNTSDIDSGKVIKNTYEFVSGLPGQAKKSIQMGDILFSEIRPANKRYAYIDFDSQDYVVSTKLMVLRSKKIIAQAVIYFFLTRNKTLESLQLLAESRSGTFPQITFDQIAELNFRLPIGNLRTNLENAAGNILSKICFNNKNVRTLSVLRDGLLPKLMSGEVRVKV